MKRKWIAALLLACLLTLGACGEQGEADTDPETPPEEEVQQVTPETLAGTYQTAGVFGTTYTFHDNTTYDIESTRPDTAGKGTFEIGEDGSLLLTDADNGGTQAFARYEDTDIWYRTEPEYFSYFEGDEEYGLELTLDDAGRTGQQFGAELIYGDTENRHMFYVTFREDGTCTIHYNIIEDQGWGERIVQEEYEGTYAADGAVITLSYNGEEHPLICQDGRVYFYTLQQTGA